MVMLVSGLVMRVGRFSRLLTGVGVLTLPGARVDTTCHVESVCDVPPGAGVLQLLVCRMAVGVIVDHRCIADGVEVTC